MLKRIVLGIILNALALYAVTFLLSDIHYSGGLKFFVIGGFIIGLLNVLVKPLMKLLSFPLLVMSVGLFSIVINTIIFWLTMKIVNGIHISEVSVIISSAWTYVFAAFFFGVVNWFIHLLIRNK